MAKVMPYGLWYGAGVPLSGMVTNWPFMESIAARAGVSKATIYKRWPTKLAVDTADNRRFVKLSRRDRQGTLVARASWRNLPSARPNPDTTDRQSPREQCLDQRTRTHQAGRMSVSRSSLPEVTNMGAKPWPQTNGFRVVGQRVIQRLYR